MQEIWFAFLSFFCIVLGSLLVMRAADFQRHARGEAGFTRWKS